MAKVKITGHASGSGVITVTAPNTSTDRTITLPDSTGTILDENSSLPAANLTGTVATARLGSGTASSGTILYGDQTYKTAPTSFNPDAAVVINESGADVDFRVESDTVTHALFVQGSDGRVGIGGTPTNMLSLFPTEQSSIRKIDFGLYNGGTDNTFVQTAHHSSNGNVREIGLEGSVVNFYTGAESGTSTTKRLSLTADGRGVSQFTAACWCCFDGQGTISIRDSHNVASLSDEGTADYTVNIDSDMANATYAVVGSAGRDSSTGFTYNYGVTFSLKATHSIRMRVRTSESTGVDVNQNMIVIFGDQ